MSPIESIAAVALQAGAGSAAAPPAPALSPSPMSFGDLLGQGLNGVQERLNTADDLVRRFALGEDPPPIHEVTIALEEARMAVELMVQVRTRLVDAYRDIMNMQL